MKITLSILMFVACLLQSFAAHAADCDPSYARNTPEMSAAAVRCMELATKHVREITAYKASIATAWGSRIPALKEVQQALVEMESIRARFTDKKNDLRAFISPDGHFFEGTEAFIPQIKAEAAELKGRYIQAQAAYEKAVKRAIPLWTKQLMINMTEAKAAAAAHERHVQIEKTVEEKLKELIGDLP